MSDPDDDGLNDESNNQNSSKFSLAEFIDIDADAIAETPIDLNIARMTAKTLNSLHWCHYEVLPKKLKVTNTGKTVVLSAKWRGEVPFIRGGPFSSKQIFSQIHLHWGENDMQGSDHSADGESLPMELHAVHFKSNYRSHESAMRKPDGISIVVHFFKSMENEKLSGIVKNLTSINQVKTSTRIAPVRLNDLLSCFADDYFVYRGSISNENYRHSLTWLISRQTLGISVDQIQEFRKLNAGFRTLSKNHEKSSQMEKTIVYHVNPSGSMFSTLFSISRSLLAPKVDSCSEEKTNQ